MKKLLLTFGLSLIGFSAFSQTAYEKVMTEKIAKVEDQKSADDYTALANDFERIGNKEASKWQPYYYAAFATIQKGRAVMRNEDKTALDGIAADADKYIAKAELLSPNNAELYILKKMTSGLRMMVDPMSRYMTETPVGKEALAKAKAIDPGNPRITILEAEDVYFTPEQFGGSKTKGLELFKKAIEQFSTYKLKTPIDPNWGKGEAEHFLNQK